jgi:hypothetical protein
LQRRFNIQLAQSIAGMAGALHVTTSQLLMLLLIKQKLGVIFSLRNFHKQKFGRGRRAAPACLNYLMRASKQLVCS